MEISLIKRKTLMMTSIFTQKITFPIILVMFFLFSCSNNKQEIERLEAENEQLRDQIDQSSDNVENYFSELNEIEENLRLIKEKENLITGQAGSGVELGVPQQERINQDIQRIGELMEKNRILIASLNNRLRNADTRIAGFEKMIENLNQTIEEKEIEITLLRDQLASMNFKVDMLTARVDTLEMVARERSQTIEQQTIELNTAYYAIGSQKELIENQIISREGGFLGIGKTERIKADFNHDFFTRIDLTRDKEITIIGERPELITVHPEDSYEINTEDGERYLEIIDEERFWSTSRYLVIQVR